jgi:hypothetical protein
MRMLLANILRVGTTALRRMHVPLFLSKYSKRDFTVHQHLLLCAVRELEKETWRGLRDRIEDSKAVDEHLDLKRTPHFTTPQKFLRRIPKPWFGLLLKRMVDLLVSEYRVSADATCFRLRSASTHYLTRVGQAIEVRDTRKSVDLLELQTGLFLATRGIPGHRHEAPRLVPMVRSLPGTRDVVGDKAFDGESIHRGLRNLGVEGYIDVKGGRNTPSRGLRLRVLGFKEDHPEVWRETYTRPRAFHESTYHALKAVVGDFLPGRTPSMQDRYRALKYFAWDLYLLARDHLEEVLSSFWRRISTDLLPENR